MENIIFLDWQSAESKNRKDHNEGYENKGKTTITVSMPHDYGSEIHWTACNHLLSLKSRPLYTVTNWPLNRLKYLWKHKGRTISETESSAKELAEWMNSMDG